MKIHIPYEAVEAAKEAMYRAEMSGPRAGASLDTLASVALEAAAPFMAKFYQEPPRG